MDDVIDCGIKQFSWPGRYQQISDRNHQWFLDRAHTELSVRYAAEWFVERVIEHSRLIHSQIKIRLTAFLLIFKKVMPNFGENSMPLQQYHAREQLRELYIKLEQLEI
ncbi:uncharacterized protein BDCG_16516 [Blastomyces dermatitidis ER-3]|uniref:Uncharacterized protein n=1 Tax=Ajellomyces dermatitidis (strain ER-3 / ATCC MYA-2586) TaxID=559297 RepID=A0ABX2VSM5_AJEDR|nr:uncharacterized protein BDCG_16516 [Blastomyces dermatitidis ER-3]EQL33193.1 hypothetical protein BDFG_04639 [Blastomyces dermatitidis ATCC 26199]OAT00217.1 hypothetical protein BDCG_16516 [Blastomyces dermatitidis ER-3]